MDPLQNNVGGVPVNTEKKSFGPIIGIALIIIVLIAGALYFWGGAVSKENAEVAPVSSSDEVSSIEQDLSAGGDFQADFSNIEADLQ